MEGISRSDASLSCLLSCGSKSHEGGGGGGFHELGKTRDGQRRCRLISLSPGGLFDRRESGKLLYRSFSIGDVLEKLRARAHTHVVNVYFEIQTVEEFGWKF